MKKVISMLILLLPLASYAESVKIGVVDLNLIFNEYKSLTGLDVKLQGRFEAPNKELETLAKEIEADEKKLKANEVMLTENKSKKSKEALIEKAQRFNEKKSILGKEMQAAYNKEIAVFRELMLGVTQKLGKEEKYTLITQTEGVMYINEENNITAKVLTRLKAELPKL